MNTDTGEVVKLAASNQKYGDSTSPWIARITGAHQSLGVALAFIGTGSRSRYAFVREGLYRTRDVNKKGKAVDSNYVIWRLRDRLILTEITEKQSVEWCQMSSSELARMAAHEELRDRQAAQVEAQAGPQDDFVRVDEQNSRELCLPEGVGQVTRREFCAARALMITAIEAMLAPPVATTGRRAEILARLDALRNEQIALETELASL